MSTATVRLDAAIAEAEAKVAKLKAIRNAIDDDQIREELAGIFGSSKLTPRKNGSRPKSMGRPQGSSVYDNIRQLFIDNGNEWMTLSDIEAHGIKKASARQVLYIGKAEEFERESRPGAGRQTKFRLKHPK